MIYYGRDLIDCAKQAGMTGPKIFFKFCATLFRFQSIKDRKQNHSRTAGDRKGWIQMTEMDNTKRDDKKV